MFKSDLEYKQFNFGHNAKLEGYATLMSDIDELCAINLESF